MNIGNAFGIHEQALQVRSKRNELIASNIANADTPNYKARDINFRDALAKHMVQPVTLKATSAGHIQPAGGAASIANYVKFRKVDQASLDGNTVDVQQEQVKFSQNTAQFEATMRFLDGKIKGLQKAIKGS